MEIVICSIDIQIDNMHQKALSDITGLCEEKAKRVQSKHLIWFSIRAFLRNWDFLKLLKPNLSCCEIFMKKVCSSTLKNKILPFCYWLYNYIFSLITIKLPTCNYLISNYLHSNHLVIISVKLYYISVKQN